MGLAAHELREALATIGAWRADPDVPRSCPKCSAPGLAIADHSARPYSEWYKLTCAACGLDETINIPLGPPVTGALD